MSHETKLAAGQEKHYHGHREEVTATTDSEIECEITQLKGTPCTFNQRMGRIMEKFASTRFGQMIMEKTDRVLKVLEDTAKWSLPQEDPNVRLERPLPWIFFLSLIVWLRLVRICLSIGSYMVGVQPVTPHSMVYNIQIKRRRLRAIRIQGLKLMRNRESETTAAMQSSNVNIKVIEKLRKLFGSAICKPGQHGEVATKRVFVLDGKNVKNLQAERSSKRPRNDDCDDENVVDIQNLTVSELLDKYANEDSENDSDFIPNEDELIEENTSTSPASSSCEELTEKESDNICNGDEKETGDFKEKDEIKENGETKHRSIPFGAGQTETPTTVGSDGEQMHTPKEMPETNKEAEAGSKDETPVAAAKVAPKVDAINPKSLLNPLADISVDDIKRMSTPGHESAASQKPFLPTADNAVPLIPSENEKSYRNITTQTAVELDWTITIKTEISHKKHYPKLENLSSSVNLTPASSTEDIFYSPMGSLQDIHSIFHPAPIIKNTLDEAQIPTPKETDQLGGNCSSETPITTAATNNHKKHFNQHTHTKHNYHHNAKNRSKNRR